MLITITNIHIWIKTRLIQHALVESSSQTYEYEIIFSDAKTPFYSR